jgi:hypothetical protein
MKTCYHIFFPENFTTLLLQGILGTLNDVDTDGIYSLFNAVK